MKVVSTPLIPDNEEEIVLKSINDRDAFVILYDIYYPRLYNYVRARVNNVFDTEDLTSQIFEKVLANLHTFDPAKGKFRGWFFRIAHNTIVDYYKHRVSIQ